MDRQTIYRKIVSVVQTGCDGPTHSAIILQYVCQVLMLFIVLENAGSVASLAC